MTTMPDTADIPPEDDTARLRVPPHSAEAEQSLLGGLMLDASHWPAVSELVAEADFYRHEHRTIFAAMVPQPATLHVDQPQAALELTP